MPRDGLNNDERRGARIDGKISLTIEEAAERLTRAGHSWSPKLHTPTVVTYAFRASAPGEMPAEATGFERFTSAQIQGAEAALKAWALVANIRFVRVGSGQSGDGAYSDDATILFGNYTSGLDGTAAFAVLPGDRASGAAQGDVWVNSRYASSASPISGEGFLTLMHEIGHAIGLSHPADYDSVDGGDELTYANDAGYYEDSTEYSIMSYFDATETGASLPYSLRAPSGPLVDDIAAVQRLYGANYETSRGNTTYGYNHASPTSSAWPDSNLAFFSGSTLWGTVWDGGGIDTINFDNTYTDQKIDLRAGAFSNVGGAAGTLSIALGTTIEKAIGGGGNDLLIGNDVHNVLDGRSGNDTLVGGRGGDVYIGGYGEDVAVLSRNAADFTLIDGGANGTILLGRNGGGMEWIDASVETVRFADGQYLALRDLPAYVTGADIAGTAVVAPLQGLNRVFGSSVAVDTLFLGGVAAEFQLSRVPARDGPYSGLNEYSLIASDSAVPGGPSGVIFSDDIDRVQFGDGQYLALRDLASYVSADRSFGSADNDLITQTRPTGYQFFWGGSGSDTLSVRANVWDFVVRPFAGQSAAAAQGSFGGLPYEGMLLTSTNGSGALLIDHTIETVQFLNGEQYRLEDLQSHIAGGGIEGRLLFGTPGASDFSSMTYFGNGADDTVLLNQNASDFTLSRGTRGDIVLTSAAQTVALNQSVDTVRFANGQYLSLRDLPAYITGNATFGAGSGDNDQLLIPGASGRQFLVGQNGFDHAYAPGNVSDYTLTPVEGSFPESFLYFVGVELDPVNGGPTLFIDRTTEIVHFANGQYLAFADLPAYIPETHAFA